MTLLGAVGKSPEAFRTISEVSVELDVPQHVLRFWETKFGAVKPLKRGGGRRYYRPEDLDLLRGIRTLLHGDGLTIKGVQKILREHGPRYVIELGRGATTLINTGHAAPGIAQPPLMPLSNVHAFPKPDATRRGLTEAERARFSQLLDELLEMKARLKSARRVSQVSP